jgi:outer membrane protein OmpA-like peptidoglycan-associated protein
VNLNLSTNRAESVYNYLKKNGLDMQNITYKGYGSKKERYFDERDRRIEFKINDDLEE